jgi:capsular polysaccharide biosynthesis protein
MGSFSGQLRAKADKILHDSAADLAWRLRTPLREAKALELARSQTTIAESQISRWRNPLEDQFYGGSAMPNEILSPPAVLYRFAKVFVTGSEALLFADFGTRIVADKSQAGVMERKARRPIHWLARQERNPVFPMGGRGTGNRGHFLCEHLPRLMVARQSGACPENMHLLLTPGHEKWQSEYLRLLGERSESFLPGSHGSIFCHSLVTVPNLSMDTRADLYKPETYAEIRNRFFAVCPASKGPRRNVFVSRSDAKSRRLVNEKEIYAVCREFWPDLEFITLTGMSLAEQVILMRQSATVIGPHGQSFHLNLFLSDALSIQLVPGERHETNEYLLWATNYERLGTIGGNRCISLFAGPNVTGEDWCYPIHDLRQKLQRLKELVGGIQ